MAVITVATGDIENYEGSETAPLLRVFFSKPFVAANLDIIGRSTPESGDFYTEAVCSVAAGVITYPQFTIPSTEDAHSNENDSRMTVALFSAAGQLIQILFKGLTVPASPTSTTLGAIVQANDEEDEAPAASATAITNGGGTPKITTSASAPASPAVGDWWLEV